MKRTGKGTDAAGPKGLIVTGGFVAMRERSLVRALQRQVASHRASRGGWLDLQMKLRIGVELLAQQAFLRSRELRRKPYRDAARATSDRTWRSTEPWSWSASAMRNAQVASMRATKP
jgi:hypothetical protein